MTPPFILFILCGIYIVGLLITFILVGRATKFGWNEIGKYPADLETKVMTGLFYGLIWPIIPIAVVSKIVLGEWK